MATKIKGIYRGFKFISQIFVVKEKEMEIGYPTDVKHVAHIGYDPSSSSAPSWMNEFNRGSDFSTTSASYSNPTDSSSVALSTWSSQDFDQSIGQQPVSQMWRDISPTDTRTAPRKQKRKKKETPSPMGSTSSSFDKGDDWIQLKRGVKEVNRLDFVKSY